MEKIININFQGRVIPIEETAYDNLKQYIDSLKGHFANEESNDEIINDIENRIAELLGDRLKHGANCINNSHVNAVIDSIGRLEDIEAAEGEENKAPKNDPPPIARGPMPRGRFYRDADDKIIAGVCSGLGTRLGIDPVVVRILFVLLFGALFWIYIILWIIVPSQSMQSNVTRRLYRNPDDKVIAGVCGGLAVYFRTETWVPRLIFLLPVILGVVFRGMFGAWWHWHMGLGPRFFTGSFGSSLFILYIILWIALPYASSASDILEMRGEKIDMNSIKAASQAKASAGPGYNRPRASGLGRVIGILFKAFFLFIAGIFALGLFGILIGLVFAGVVAIPFTDFVLSGLSQYTLAWVGIILFFGVPLLAFTTWLVRRIMGVRSHRHYLGFIFAGLWLVGLFCVLTLSGILVHNFSYRADVDDTVAMQQPSSSKLYVNVNNNHGLRMVHYGRWYGDWEKRDAPFHLVNADSLWLNSIKVQSAQSPDSLYHIYETRISRGTDAEEARKLASHISFNVVQQDSVLNLPGGFTISNRDKFRNQQVMIVIEVPLGKSVQFSNDINNYTWINGSRRHRIFIEQQWDNDEYYNANTNYIMTASGLKDFRDTAKHHHDKDNNKDDDDDDDDNY